jgi:hypothetical protein
VLAKGMAAIASIGHDPLRQAWQRIIESHGMWQFIRLLGRQDKGNRSARPVGDYAGLDAKAARERPNASRTSRCAAVSAFFRACRLLVGADVGTVEKGHPEWHVSLLDERQQALPKRRGATSG